MERLVDGRLNACIPLGQVLAGGGSSELGGSLQIAGKLEASLLRLLDFDGGLLRDPPLLLDQLPLPVVLCVRCECAAAPLLGNSTPTAHVQLGGWVKTGFWSGWGGLLLL